MNLISEKEHIFVPDGTDKQAALARTTALCFSAHQDDIEFMAFHAIAECFNQDDKWFTACVVTDGAGSPRAGLYADFSNDEMKAIRIVEQDKAAAVGGYAAQLQLGFTSAQVKDAANKAVTEQIARVIGLCSPETVYIHNLGDKHDTHVSVALRVIQAIRSLPAEKRPKKLYGMEVWRSLDWVNDDEKTVFDASMHPNLAAALMGVFDSQISGGKRYDAAVLGRRAANATFFESHGTDEMTEAIYAMDLQELLDTEKTPAEVIGEKIDRFKADVMEKLKKFGE